ncbi:MAG: transglutaminase domain-containing protein [Chitinophagales bacterium]|nr:transglutaminase domain-containing protein [Chitinophagales bacterium]
MIFLIKNKTLRTINLLLLLLFFNVAYTQTDIDYTNLKSQFPNEDAVVVDNSITIKYFVDNNGNIKAKAIVSEAYFVLKDNISALQSVEVPFNEFEKLNFLSGRLFSINDKNEKNLIENIKFKNASDKDYYINNIFYSDLKLKTLSLTTKVKKNNLLVFSYEVIYDDLKFLTSFKPSYEYPTINFSINLEAPSNKVNADLVPFNLPNNVLKKETDNNGIKKITYTLDTISLHNYKNDNGFSAPASYFLPHFVVVTKSYTNSKNQKEKVIEDATDLYAWYSDLVNELNPDKEYLKKLSDEIVRGQNTKEQKIEAIFDWVKANITYVAFENGIAGFKPEEAQKVEKNRFGDCKGMANLLTELLKAQNLDAHLCWIGTNALPYSYDLPSLCVDNHMICALFNNNNTYLLDATGKNNTWDNYPYYLEDKEALIEMGETYKLFKVPITTANDNLCNVSYTLDLNNYEISGKIILKGAFKHIYQSIYEDTRVEEKQDFTNELVLNLFSKSIFPKQSKLNITATEIQVDFKGDASMLLQKNNNNYYIYKPKFNFLPQTIVNKSSNAPLFFEFPFTYSVNAKYNGNYKLNSKANYNINNDVFDIQQSVTVAASQIQDNSTVKVKKAIVNENEFNNWNDGVIQYFYQNGIVNIAK